jgi:hypothetical protein
MTDLIGLAERKIGAAGEKLAAQLGGVFTINPRKLSDYRARARATKETHDGTE